MTVGSEKYQQNSADYCRAYKKRRNIIDLTSACRRGPLSSRAFLVFRFLSRRLQAIAAANSEQAQNSVSDPALMLRSVWPDRMTNTEQNTNKTPRLFPRLEKEGAAE